jgi:2-(1,2-epoxy-1,2-dihydrophenyl)acetyl-CoA isomerase
MIPLCWVNLPFGQNHPTYLKFVVSMYFAITSQTYKCAPSEKNTHPSPTPAGLLQKHQEEANLPPLHKQRPPPAEHSIHPNTEQRSSAPALPRFIPETGARPRAARTNTLSNERSLAMDFEHLILEKKERVGTITLNRPERFNSFGGRMRQEIVEALEDVAKDPEVRCVVITGVQKWFCTGGDVGEFAGGTTQALEKKATAERHAMCKAVLLINQMEKPVIASVNGTAAGGGCNLALACDIRIASDRARFAQVFVRRGVHPDWGGVYFLPRLVGYAKACELIFSGETVPADEAFRIGMVNKVAPHDGLPAATWEMASRFAGNAPIPIAFAKRGLRNFQKWDLAQALDYESYVLSVCMQSEDIIEGFGAFLEKREPNFKGR